MGCPESKTGRGRGRKKPTAHDDCLRIPVRKGPRAARDQNIIL